MKKLYFFVMALIAIKTSYAQIVNIPDEKFKYALVNVRCVDLDNDGTYDSDADTNDDGEIQLKEAEDVFRLGLWAHQISSLEGLSAFKNLTELRCSYLPLTNVDVSKNPKLTLLDLQGGKLQDLDVSQNVALTHLGCAFNELISLDVSKNTALTYLNCSFNDLGSLDITKNTSLTNLDCAEIGLKSIDLSQNNALLSLDCSFNDLTSLDITKNKNLTKLECAGMDLKSIDLSQNNELLYLNCSKNKLTSLDLSKKTSLVELYCHNNNIVELNLNLNPSIKWLECGQSSLKKLSIKNGSNIFKHMVNCENNEDSDTLFSIEESPNLESICADEEELACVQKIVDSLAYTNCVVGAACAVGIKDDLISLSHLKIYPNPSSGSFTVKATEFLHSVIVYDLFGRVLKTIPLKGGQKEAQISTPKLASGSYLIGVKTSKYTSVARLSKE